MASNAVKGSECGELSYVWTRERFAQPQAAGKYPRRYRATHRDGRERRAICRALERVPRGASILDLPCGTGRLTPLLVERGLRVTGADSSPHMLAQARQSWPDEAVRFDVRDVMATAYADDQFDAAICNRLFHHFSEPATRRRALGELGRITAGLLIVSFFNSFSLNAWRLRWKHWRRGVRPVDRIPISMPTFEADIHEAGLHICRKLPVMWGVSPQWYVVLQRA